MQSAQSGLGDMHTINIFFEMRLRRGVLRCNAVRCDAGDTVWCASRRACSLVACREGRGMGLSPIGGGTAMGPRPRCGPRPGRSTAQHGPGRTSPVSAVPALLRSRAARSAVRPGATKARRTKADRLSARSVESGIVFFLGCAALRRARAARVHGDGLA